MANLDRNFQDLKDTSVEDLLDMVNRPCWDGDTAIDGREAYDELRDRGFSLNEVHGGTYKIQERQ